VVFRHGTNIIPWYFPIQAAGLDVNGKNIAYQAEPGAFFGGAAGQIKIRFWFNQGLTQGPFNLVFLFPNPASPAFGDQFFPAIAPENEDGTVHVTWGDTSRAFNTIPVLNTQFFDVFYAGASAPSAGVGVFSPTQLVSFNPSLVNPNGFQRTTILMGEFFSATASGHVPAPTSTAVARVHAAWTTRSPHITHGPAHCSVQQP
jgi:hypothetical protein